MQVGSEFLHLCQEQVDLLTSGFGASLAIVALVERPMRDINAHDVAFLPVITYPDAFTTVDPHALQLWLVNIWRAEVNHGSVHESAGRYEESSSVGLVREKPSEGDVSLLHSVDGSSLQAKDFGDSQTVIPVPGGSLGPRAPLAAPNQNQLVMPLIYQELMVGLLVTARVDRGWNQLERYDIERVGHTLAAACVLEQRSQWLEQRLHQQTTAYAQIQEHQQDVLDDVLHQFRNPLTALRTFGKLLIKRLQPTDRNHAVAESIVRESDRLQELLQQLGAAASLPPMALPGAQDNVPTHATVLIPSTTDVPMTAERGWSESSSSPEEYGSRETPNRAIQSNEDGQGGGRVDDETVSSSDSYAPDTVKALTGESLQLQAYDPMDILGPLLLSAQAIAQDRTLELYVTCLDDRGPIWADAKALREIYNNLIDNALKYTPAQGRVDIIVGVESEVAMFAGDESSLGDSKSMKGLAIADTGPGIPLGDQTHLFERHFRGVQSQGEIPGTGLGLAIAQLLTQHMGGIIQVFSPVDACPLSHLKHELEQARQEKPPTLIGAGTLFIVWLPGVA